MRIYIIGASLFETYVAEHPHTPVKNVYGRNLSWKPCIAITDHSAANPLVTFSLTGSTLALLGESAQGPTK